MYVHILLRIPVGNCNNTSTGYMRGRCILHVIKLVCKYSMYAQYNYDTSTNHAEHQTCGLPNVRTCQCLSMNTQDNITLNRYIRARKCNRTSDIFRSFSVNVWMLSTLSGHCVSSKEVFMAVGGCHCSGDRLVVCHFLLLIR